MKLSNRVLASVCGVIFAAMVGAGFAAVPLYRAFCNATGFDGTTGRAETAPARILDKTIEVRFDANTRDLDWTFRPLQVSQTVRIGETKLAHFTVTNNADTPLTGQATFNVLPETVGAYFKKLQCFCFEEQTLAPGQSMDFAVVYFVDPKFARDPETRDFPQITLSYTFFPSKDGAIRESVADAANAPLGEGAKPAL